MGDLEGVFDVDWIVPPPENDGAANEHRQDAFEGLTEMDDIDFHSNTGDPSNTVGTATWELLSQRGESNSQSREENECDEWPWLDSSSESKNQEILFELHNAFEKSRSQQQAAEFIAIRGTNVPIFKRPPGFQSTFTKNLESSARQWAIPTFKMGDAVCIVDQTSRHEAMPTVGERVSFPGPKSRSLESSQSGLYVARRGADKIPDSSTVKPWRIDVVRSKEDPSGPWYVCVYVPRQARSRTSRKSGTPSTDVAFSTGDATSVPEVTKPSVGDTESDPEVSAFMTSFVDLLVVKARSAGHLSQPGEEGVEQEKRFRKSLVATLQRVVKPFTVRELNPKWADHVFKDTYGRLSLSQVFEHIDKKGHLPWIRAEREVQESGVDLIGDHGTALITIPRPVSLHVLTNFVCVPLSQPP
eukprot:150283-Rhodomonas_salina.4